MYAILDIETTGGKLNEQGITEFAIYRFDGNQVVDQLISLVNPQIPIDPFVIKLTGISDSMLRTAPKFYELAKRIVEITDGCTLVAHNADFDYRMLKIEFNRLGFDYKIDTLCTVELARKLLPDQPSYSLGKLVHSLGIPITDRHRASGDAIATLKLFQLLLSKDLKKESIQQLVKSSSDLLFASKIIEVIDELPATTGVFYVQKKDGTIIYIGRNKSIQKGVTNLFAKISKKAKRIQKEAFSISFEETGNELIAQLKEIEEIQNNKPFYNLHKKRKEKKWGLFLCESNALQLKKTEDIEETIIYFDTLGEAKKALQKPISKYHLYIEIENEISRKKHFLTGTGKISETKPQQTLETEVRDSFIKEITLADSSFILITKGRDIKEHSSVLIEKGIYKGFAFYDLNYQITNKTVLKKILVPMQNTKEAINIIQNYCLRNGAFLKMKKF